MPEGPMIGPIDAVKGRPRNALSWGSRVPRNLRANIAAREHRSVGQRL